MRRKCHEKQNTESRNDSLYASDWQKRRIARLVPVRKLVPVRAKTRPVLYAALRAHRRKTVGNIWGTFPQKEQRMEM